MRKPVLIPIAHAAPQVISAYAINVYIILHAVLTMFVHMHWECIPVGCVPPAAVAVRGSASVHAGIHTPPRCGPGDAPLPRPDPSTSQLGVGLEIPPTRPLNFPPWVWTWKHARHAGTPPHLETCCKTCWDTTPPPSTPWTESQARVKT